MILKADARHIPLKDETVDCVVTSPPYWGLRDYGVKGQIGLERTPEEYVSTMVEVFREVYRVMKPQGTLWLNLGDCYATGAGKVGECPGGGEQGARWRGSNQTWNKGNRGTNHGHIIGPTTQPNRMPIPGLKPKDLVGIPWRVAFALQADGWYLRSDIIWAKPNPMPESVRDRPTKAHEYIFLLSKSQRYYYDIDAVRERSIPDSRDKFWGKTKQTSRHDHKHDAERGMMQYRTQADGFVHMNNPLGHNIRSVWTIATQPYPEAHFATFPEEIPERCIKAGCPEGGLVLDPFIGSGTTGRVAERLNRRWVGLDLAYQHLAQKRLRNVQKEIF